MDHFDLVQSFLEQRERGRPIEALATDFQRALESLGISHFACGSHIDPIHPPRGTFVHHNYPRRWMEAFSHSRLHEVDPVLTYAERHGVPFFWSDSRFRDRLGPEHRVILAAAGTLGITYGFTIPFHGRGRRGEPPASCSFVLDSSGIDERSCFTAHLLAACFHEAGRNAMSPGRTIRVRSRFSQPEQDCMELAVLGMTDWRVGEILGISESDVRAHMAHAMQLLRMPTREQAVAHALALGQLRFGDVQRTTESLETVLAHEAAYWVMRFNDGKVDQGTRLDYARWLATSPTNVEAVEFLLRLYDSAHASECFLPRHPRRMH